MAPISSLRNFSTLEARNGSGELGCGVFCRGLTGQGAQRAGARSKGTAPALPWPICCTFSTCGRTAPGPATGRSRESQCPSSADSGAQGEVGYDEQPLGS